jgi:twinkle protein
MATKQSGTAGTADGQAVSRRLSATAEAYAEERGISCRTLERLRVGSGTPYFAKLSREQDALTFFYFANGGEEPTYWKARAAGDEKAFTSMPGGKVSFYNLDAVLAGDLKIVFIVEGEIDAASLVEAGVPTEYVLSVPGAPLESKNDGAERDPPTGYAYVKDALQAGLSAAKKLVFCGDADAVGRNLRQDLARVLGVARYHFVDWPEGVKDANEFLVRFGGAQLLEFVKTTAKPWPVDGLFRLSELPDPPPLVLWNPGFAEWESKIRLARGSFSIVTGQPGHGKTQLWSQIWFQIVQAYDIPIFSTTFETRAKPHMRRTLRTLLSGRLEKDMSEQEKLKADRWIDERYLWGVHPNDRPTLEWWLDMAEVAVVRHGAQIVQLDPWNRLESQRDPRKESETEYIGRCLTEIYAFAQQLNAHVQILAHPAKMDGKQRGKAPELEDISGSKHWDNRVDQGFVVHRKNFFENGQRCTEATLFHRKARFEELGYPCQLKLDFDINTGRYRSMEYDPAGYGKAA